MLNVFAAINRMRGARAFCQVLFLLLTFPLYCLGFFIPKSKDIWVFGNVFGYRDDARYLFEYVSIAHPQVTAVWIYHKGASCPAGINSYSRFQLAGLWYQFRARFAFVSTGRGDIARFTLAKTNIIQLWHGIPVKRILLDSAESTPFAQKNSLLNRAAMLLLRYSLSGYHAVIASSPTVQRRLASAFGLPASKVVVTGYPRHDIIWQAGKEVHKRLLYAPTWRRNLAEARGIVRQICNREFISSTKELGYELWVSIHPLNREIEQGLLGELGELVHFVGKEDINIVLAQSAVLITDYSSLAIDFGLLKRPVIFFAPDRDEYFEERGIYSEFKSCVMECSLTSSADICRMLATGCLPLTMDADKFFSWRDSGARKRIVEMVREKRKSG